MNIDARMKEAETYEAMGLLAESLGTYEEILSGSPNLAPDYLATIREKIDYLKTEIQELERKELTQLSSEDITMIRDRLAADEDVQTTLDSAQAFKELGLFAEAAGEYEKLFDMEFPRENIATEIFECYMKIYSPFKILDRMMKVLKNRGLEPAELARIIYKIGLEMESRGHDDPAFEFFQKAAKTDPKSDDIKKKLETVTAKIASGSRYDYLLNKKMVTKEQLQQALGISKKTNKSVEQVIIEQFKISKDEVIKSLSFYYGCPLRKYDPEVPTPVELMTNLKKPFLLHNLWVPISWDKEGVEILVDDPKDLNKTDQIRTLIKTKKINFSVGIKEDIEAFIKQFFDGKTVKQDPGAASDGGLDDYDLIPDIAFEEEEEDTEEGFEEFDEASGQVVKLVDQVLVAAYRKNASDVHVEPSPITKSTSIRFRLDGVCQDYLQVPNSMAKGILSRIKIMSNLDIAEKRLPQDGKIKFKRKGVPPFELRVATLPTAGGFEDAVLRILAKAGAMKLAEMGLNERNLRIMRQILAQPYGLVLVVGPTGSGKTTSLHAALGHINKPGIKIWTAEDPIEITQAGLRQVEAKPKIGLDFARIMRSFLRADPDVIMIGEMRDEETASIGVEASLTGHLVFSTLHTNSAPETVTRLLDMGLNPLNFSDAFLGVLAQRLVRRLCKKCREEYNPSREEFMEVVQEYGEEAFQSTGYEYTRDLMFHRPMGCEACSGTGYSGRMGIHELMEGTKVIKKMIKKQANTEELFQQASEEGMTTLKQDGIIKCFEGHTDITEVRRVCIA